MWRLILGIGLSLFGVTLLVVVFIPGLVDSTPENNRFIKGLVIAGVCLIVGLGNIWAWFDDRKGRESQAR